MDKLKHPVRFARTWLQKSQRTNRDALIFWAVTFVLGTLVSFLGLKLVLWLLNLADLVDVTHSVKVWAVAILMAAMLVVGFLSGLASRPHPSELQALDKKVEEKKAQVDAYDLYTEHAISILAEIRLILRGELPNATYQELVETGVFEPANRLLSGDGQRGECRFSILEEHGGKFYMARDGKLYPALNHRLQSRYDFELQVGRSFSRFAFLNGVPAWSDDVDDDERWVKHDKASPKRPYKSIVTVPLRRRSGVIYGVFNVISTVPSAFDEIDRNYLAVLGAVIDVARAVYAPQARQARDTQDQSAETPSSDSPPDVLGH